MHLLGTVAGFVPDAARVQDALNAGAVECVALGVPPEDLEALARLAAGDATIDLPTPPMKDAALPAAGAPGLEGIHAIGRGDVPKGKSDTDFEALDPTQQRLLDLLGQFGDTRIPSPDLDVAFHWARENHRPVEALDLDDEAHAEVYIKANKFRHILRSGRLLKKIQKKKFEATDAFDLACQWDAFLNSLPSLQAVEAAREQHMADRIRSLAKVQASLLAIVPAPRLAGVWERLQTTAS